MTNTNVLVGGSNISGNIGSCEIKNNTYSVSSFITRSTSINSCTGQIVSDNTYYDWSYIYFPGAIIAIVIFIAIFFRVIRVIFD